MQALVGPLLAMPRPAKRILALIVDSSLCVLTIWLAYCFRLNEWTVLTGVQWLAVLVSLCLALPIFVVMGMYRAIFRYAGIAAFLAVLKAIAIYGVAFATIFTALSVPGIPRTVGILQPFASVDRNRPFAPRHPLLARRYLSAHPSPGCDGKGADLWRGQFRPAACRRTDE